LRIHLEVDSSAEEILTGQEARELITIAREALNNCVRHAQATRIEIALRHYGSRVRLRIRDNGLGFDVVQGLAKGLGFAHMQDRVRRIGGHLDIESTIGGGTCITAEGPQIEDIDMMGLIADGAKIPGNNPRLLEP
jgi:signal transduction histidine kinase